MLHLGIAFNHRNRSIDAARSTARPLLSNQGEEQSKARQCFYNARQNRKNRGRPRLRSLTEVSDGIKTSI